MFALGFSAESAQLFLSREKRFLSLQKALYSTILFNYMPHSVLIKSTVRHTVCVSTERGRIDTGDTMSTSKAPTTFIIIAIAIFLATIALLSGGEMNVIMFTAIPIIFGAEGIVFVLLYATIYHSEAEGSGQHPH